jgi:hypothetical protein
MSSALQQEGTFSIPEATEAELQEAVDYAARFYLGISAEEFTRRLAAHELCEDDPQVQNVLYVLNFVGSADREAKL